jgi:hypothetical protein
LLGSAAFETAYSEGQRLSPAQALQAASSDQRDSSRSALGLRHFGTARAPRHCRPARGLPGGQMNVQCRSASRKLTADPLPPGCAPHQLCAALRVLAWSSNRTARRALPDR